MIKITDSKPTSSYSISPKVRLSDTMDNGLYDSYTRLRDLSDKEASELLKNVFDKLEQAGTSADLSEIAGNLNISPLLLDDIVQVMIIKGWLELPQE